MKKALYGIGLLLALGGCSDSSTVEIVDADADGYTVTEDCDDARADAHPGADEVCNGLDDDCDDVADEMLGVTYYADTDHDGYGDAASPVLACDGAPIGAVADATDCNDTDAIYHPGAAESCSAGLDTNCDGSAGDVDADHDGFVACLDCNDGAMAVNPDATEVCDALNVDEDCSGAADDADANATGKSTFYADTDHDDYGDASAPIAACDLPEGSAANDDDCDDDAMAVNPDATEVCDADDVDEDCDGLIDDADGSATGQATYYADADHDTYGDAGAPVLLCDATDDVVADATDCDDTLGSVHPGAAEVCDTVDQDCDDTLNFGHDVPTDHATIQAAVNDAATGSHICVLPGTYAGFYMNNGKTLVIEGADRDTTIIDPNYAGNAISVTDQNLTVRHFTIRRASSYAILVSSGANTGTRLFEDLDIGNGQLTNGGDCSGVIHLNGLSATLRDVDVHDNVITCGNQTSGVISLTNSQATMTLERVRIVNNSFNVGSAHRGTVFVYNGNVVASNVVIAGNRAQGTTAGRTYWTPGFAADVYGTNTVTVRNADVVGNYADANMGAARAVGFYGQWNATIDASNVTIAYNTSALGSATRAHHVLAVSSITYGNVYGNDPLTASDWGAVADQAGTNGNLSVDPGYVSRESLNPLDWDLSLAIGSALIDAGNPALSDADATRSDIGAYGGPGGDF